MSHNSRLRAPTFWTLDSSVTPGEFEAFDQAQFEAVNGDLGGTWAPAASIVIGGAGMQVTGPGYMSDAKQLDIAADGQLTILNGATVEVYSDNIFDGGTTTFRNGATLAMTDLSVFSIDADSDMTCAGSITLSGSAAISIGSGCALTVQSGGDAACASGGTFTVESGGELDLDLGGIMALEGKLRIDGQVRAKLQNQANTSFLTTNDQPSYVVSVNDGSVHTVTCHIATTPPETGQLMFIRVDLTNAGSGVNVGNEGGPAGGIAVFGTGTGRGGLILQWNNTANTWRVIAGWGTNLAYGASA